MSKKPETATLRKSATADTPVEAGPPAQAAVDPVIGPIGILQDRVKLPERKA